MLKMGYAVNHVESRHEIGSVNHEESSHEVGTI